MRNKVVFGLVLVLFSGCGFFVKSEKEIDMKDFARITEGKFESLSDFTNLFPKSVEDVQNRSEYMTSKAKEDLAKFLAIKTEDRNFENTVRGFDQLEARFDRAISPIHVLEMVSPDEKVRVACNKSIQTIQEFAVDAFCNKDIYLAFKGYVEGNKKQEKLNPEQGYAINEAMQGFTRQGFDLPEEKFLQVKELRKELAKLSLEFSTNINLDKSKIVVKKEELEGMDSHFINSLDKDNEGNYILLCNGPTYMDTKEHCKVGDTRKKMYFAYQNRAYPKNMDLLKEIINKRDELAKLLGFKNYAELDLDSEMIKTPERAKSFLLELGDNALSKLDKEYFELIKDLPEGVNLDNGKFCAWDFDYTKEWYKKKHFDIDERKIAEYFPVQNTLDKIFEIYQKFLGLTFKFADSKNIWHEDVKVVQIYDKDGQKLLGVLFLDLYPRENKYSHACMCPMVATLEYKDCSGNLYQVPAVTTVIANFPKATGDRPALLKHDDVKTFFHEFGHAMHGLLGKTELESTSGTSVKTDFVEVPSQMFEEWLWDKDILKMISCHYKTGESLPGELIDKMLKLKTFDSGYFLTRQCFLSLFALDYFMDGKNKDTGKIRQGWHDKYIKYIKFEPNDNMPASFGHLTGYGAKYYSYMWSKVFSLDLFNEIKKHGLLNPEIGQKIIETVLGRGGSNDPEILVKNFLGRDANQKAMLKDLGIN